MERTLENPEETIGRNARKGHFSLKLVLASENGFFPELSK
jgi:hypothetical protein